MRMFIIISVVIIILIGGIYIIRKNNSVSISQIESTPQPSIKDPLQTTKPTQQVPLQTTQPTQQAPLQTAQPTQPVLIMPTRTPQTPSPTTAINIPLTGSAECNYSGDLDYEYNVCICNSTSAGKNCEFTRNRNCKGNGNPIANQFGVFTGCSCDLNSVSPYCCSKSNSSYINRNPCSENISCTSNSENGGWVTNKINRSDFSLQSPACQNMCSDIDRPYLRWHKGIASCDNYSDYDFDVFLRSLHYSPDDNDLNNKYWKLVETDRDLTNDRNSRRNTSNYQADKSQGKYGSFFIAYKFKDSSTNPNEITNQDLKNAIDAMFDQSQDSFSMDNYGNISISFNNIPKEFKNPLFPKIEESDVKLNRDQCINNNYRWNDQEGKCYIYRINTEGINRRSYRQKSQKSTRYFLTDANRKWILYNDKHDEINPNTKTAGQYYILYNPIHGKKFKDYYDRQSSTITGATITRMNDFLIKKYGELNAKKNTYNIKDRQYGDKTSRCTAGYSTSDRPLPDCSFDVFGATYPIGSVEGQLIYDLYKGQCACASGNTPDAISACEAYHGTNSYVKTYKEDIAKTLYERSKNNKGQCPSIINNNVCINQVDSAGNVIVQGSSISCRF